MSVCIALLIVSIIALALILWYTQLEDEDLSKVLENKLKKRVEQLQENSFWTSVISSLEREGIDYVTEYENIVKAVTVESVADFAKQVLNGNLKEIVQLPVK